jgi:hypothetical protein
VLTARYALCPYIKQIRFVFKGLNKALGTATAQSVRYPRYGPVDAGFDYRQRDFSLPQNVQTGSGAHPTSSSKGIGDSPTWSKAAGA